MYDYIYGKINTKKATQVTIECSGVGYLIKISLSTSKALPVDGEYAKLFTYLHVREDALQLFGFASEEEREIFTGLIGVSGIGPKLALTALSGMTPADFVSAIFSADEKILSSISGIGKKTAQRLIIELKDKLPKLEYVQSISNDSETETMKLSMLEEEALMALISLGYNRVQAQKAVRKVQQKEPQLIAEALIKKSLQAI
jgi:Holliday junction DNA helicase RuvA